MTDKSETPRVDAFIRNVEKSTTGCWLWKRSKNSRGYGTAWNGEKVVLAHRLSYELFVSKPPAKLHVCHHCDTPLCVNPSHLFLGTDRDNLIDCIRKGRRPKSGPTRGQCKNAHLNQKQATDVKRAVKNRSGSLRQLSESLGISLNILKDISRGRNY